MDKTEMDNQVKLARDLATKLDKVIEAAIEQGIEPQATLVAIGATSSQMISMLPPENRQWAADFLINGIAAHIEESDATQVH